jgi:hypothetical protein
MSTTVELLESASLFLYAASAAEIESERQAMEAHYDVKLAVHKVTYPVHSGARCTRVEWEDRNAIRGEVNG